MLVGLRRATPSRRSRISRMNASRTGVHELTPARSTEKRLSYARSSTGVAGSSSSSCSANGGGGRSFWSGRALRLEPGGNSGAPGASLRKAAAGQVILGPPAPSQLLRHDGPHRHRRLPPRGCGRSTHGVALRAKRKRGSRDFNLARGPKPWVAVGTTGQCFSRCYAGSRFEWRRIQHVESVCRLTTKAHGVKSHHV
jgi:hypothetical protein